MTETSLALARSGALARIGAPDEREYLVKIMAETLGIPSKDALRPDVIAILGMAAQQAMTYGALPGVHLHVQKFETKESRERRKNNRSAEPEYTYTLVQGEKLYKDSGARWRIQYGMNWTYQRKPMTPSELNDYARQIGFAQTLPPIAFGMWSRIIMIGVDDRDDPDNPLWSNGVFLGKRKVGNNWYDEELPTGVTSRDVAIRRADKRAMMQSSLTLLPLDNLAPEQRLHQLTDHLRNEASIHRDDRMMIKHDVVDIEEDGEILWAKEEPVKRIAPRKQEPVDVEFYPDAPSDDIAEGDWQDMAARAPENAGARSENDASGPCPDCHAPAGKPHATSCPRRQQAASAGTSEKPGARPGAQSGARQNTPPAARPQERGVRVDADGVIESEWDVYASILNNPDIDLDAHLVAQIIEFQELHKASAAPFSEAQYKLLRMLFHSVLGGAEDEHKMFLSCICGTPIDHTTRPGNKLQSLITWLKSPNKFVDEIDLVQAIIALCREIREEIS